MEVESKRFAIFLENLKMADLRNAQDTAVHGITKFSDLSQSEFESQFLGSKPIKSGNERVSFQGTVNATAGLVDW
jgi:cathepsin F